LECAEIRRARIFGIITCEALFSAMWPNKVKQMTTPLPTTPAHPETYEPKKSGLPDDEIDESSPTTDDEPGESDELDPEEPVGTPASNQPTP
jgi:hypothetical protein